MSMGIIESGEYNKVAGLGGILEKIQNVIMTTNLVVPASSYVEFDTNIDWDEEIVVIPRWLGDERLFLSNYYAINNTLRLTITNVSASEVRVDNAKVHVTVIHSGNTWHSID